MKSAGYLFLLLLIHIHSFGGNPDFNYDKDQVIRVFEPIDQIIVEHKKMPGIPIQQILDSEAAQSNLQVEALQITEFSQKSDVNYVLIFILGILLGCLVFWGCLVFLAAAS